MTLHHTHILITVSIWTVELANYFPDELKMLVKAATLKHETITSTSPHS